LNTIETQEILHLDVYGAHHNWAQKFETHHRNRNSFHGFKPFEELVSKFEETDAFLLPMGFTPESRLIERTSFKTKFLDYIQYAKPVLIWGPDYCTAARTARAHDSALVVSDADPKAAVAGMLRLATDASLRKRLVENANAMRDNHFNPHKIYSVLKSSIENTIEQCGANKLSGERHKAIKS
jgi:glycosyltransferase involved in cell wall biosynthesis